MACPICKSETSYYHEQGDRIELTCPRCGNYAISGRAAGMIRSELIESQIANISYWIRRNNEPTILTTNIEFLKNLPTPTVGEKARRFITHVAKQYPKPGEYIKYIEVSDTFYLTLTGCYDKTELGYIVKDYLSDNRKFLINFSDSNNRFAFKISPEGWAYIESLKETNPESHICFVAMRFIERFNPLYDNSIMPAIIESGYEPIRVDRTEYNHTIDDEIIAKIKESKFLVAELTEQNQGVYFEAGYALGLGLQVIWLCKEADLKNVHFDNRQYHFITWNDDGFEDLKKRLINRIIATIGRGSYNPEIQ